MILIIFSYFLYFGCLGIWSLTKWEQTPHSGLSQLLIAVLPGSMPFTCKLTNPEPQHQPFPYQTHTQSQYLPSPKSPRTRWRRLETIPIAQSLLELFKPANPKLFTLLCLSFPVKTPLKILA